MISRRSFMRGVAGGAIAGSTWVGEPLALIAAPAAAIDTPLNRESVFHYVHRVRRQFDAQLFSQILGAANPFKEGDEIVGVSAANEASRQNARTLLANTRLFEFDKDAERLHPDRLYELISSARTKPHSDQPFRSRTLGELKQSLLTDDEATIKTYMGSLASDVIACVVKLMSNRELTVLGSKIFNPLPGSRIGAKGYLGARIQPNSPTDNLDDIRWQVFDGWSYAVGDVLLGTNPVSSAPDSVAAIERALQDLLTTFKINHLMPHCVLSHIDVQAEVEEKWPGSTELWFQSIAGCDSANATFDISVDKMTRYASQRTGRFGLYFETGQGADFTNGHGHGFDMVLHESRKYGFARVLTQQVAAARIQAGHAEPPWVHLNDVAGFIGPEVFRTRQQLVRCCLEDIVMGKLHGLCIGLDVCSTLHMDISLNDLDWCLDQIMPANPAYLMALPTKIDPMLGYLTTGYQDHVRLREKFGFRVNDPIWKFFQQLQVVDAAGQPTEHFGDPLRVFLQYRRLKGDVRRDDQILQDGRRQLSEVRARGVFVATGHGHRPWELQPALRADIQRIYDDAKLSIWAELKPDFVQSIPGVVQLGTKSTNRVDYILHPTSGEAPDEQSLLQLVDLRRRQEGECEVQVVISDGLNALAIMEDGHLAPFLDVLKGELENQGVRVAAENLVIHSGRVRAGYRIGESLFGGLAGSRAILHIIGERPGTGHRTFSTYITAPDGSIWGEAGRVDHNITRVVSGIATTALTPGKAAKEVIRLLDQLRAA